MKLLVSYDGSGPSEAAIDDLTAAGLPPGGEAIVVAVAEVWLPPPATAGEDEPVQSAYIESIVKKHREHGESLVAEAQALAERAADRVRLVLPLWKVTAEASYGSPAWEVIKKAESYRPDLIVVGSHGHSSIGRLLLGSISQRILTESACSVRVARGRVQVDQAAARIVVGFDGSEGAAAAVDAVAARKWLDGTEVRLFSALDDVSPSIVGRFIPQVSDMAEEMNDAERDWIKKLAEEQMEILEKAGLPTSLHLFNGNPRGVLVEEAERWNADCIFVGANAFGSRIERFLIGSTSAAVAARAHCSVEVVRTAAKK
jgi:nucleotide-binding universal stress UspA family protein